MTHIFGGCSDNAPNAKNCMELAFEKCQIAANGLGSDETPIVTFVNGVPAQYVENGSAVHVNHLIGLKFEEESVGLKAGMDNPTPGQVA